MWRRRSAGKLKRCAADCQQLVLIGLMRPAAAVRLRNLQASNHNQASNISRRSSNCRAATRPAGNVLRFTANYEHLVPLKQKQLVLTSLMLLAVATLSCKLETSEVNTERMLCIPAAAPAGGKLQRCIADCTQLGLMGLMRLAAAVAFWKAPGNLANSLSGED